MITLYHYPGSPCAGKVRAVLTEKSLRWDGKLVDIMQKENLRPEYLKLHPKGVVPVLVDDGHAIIESTIIMEYVDTKYARDSLKPEGAYEQALMRKWTKWVDETLHPNWAGLGWTILIRPTWLKKPRREIEALLASLINPARRERQARLLEQGFSSPEFYTSMNVLDTTLADMEKALAGRDWLVGDRPTLADLAVLPYVVSAEKFGLQMMYAQARPGVTAWLARWRGRPTYEATMPWELSPEHVAEIAQHGREPWVRIERQRADSQF